MLHREALCSLGAGTESLLDKIQELINGLSKWWLNKWEEGGREGNTETWHVLRRGPVDLVGRRGIWRDVDKKAGPRC